MALLELDETQEALNIILKNIQSAKTTSDKIFWKKGLIYTLIRTGKEQEAVTLLKELESFANQEANLWLFTGICYMLMGDFSHAATCFEKMKQIDTRNMEYSGAYFYALGLINLRDQKLSLGLKMWEKAYSKGIIPATQVLKNAYELVSQELFSKGNESGAMKYIRDLLKLAPKDKVTKEIIVYFHWKRGNFCATEADFDSAIKEWQKALRYQKSNVSIIHNIAIAYERMGDLEKANEYWHKAIQHWQSGRHNNSSVPKEELRLAYRHLAENYKKLNQWGGVINELGNLLNLHPNDSSTLKELGELFLEIGEKEKALSLFKKAYKINPQDSDTINWIARVYEVLGCFTEAINYLEKSLAMDEKNHFTRTMLARILVLETGTYMTRRRYDKALGLILKGISWDIQDYLLYSHLGNIYLFLDKAEEASDAFQKALEIDPSDPMIAVVVGKIHLSHKMEDTAQKYFQKAIEISSANQLPQTVKEIAFNCLASHNLRLGKKHLDNLLSKASGDPSIWMEVFENILEYQYPELAVEYLEKFINLYPQESRFYFLLSWAYDILEEKSKGQYYLERALRMAKANKDRELLQEIAAYQDFLMFDNLS
jgi:tetratricopeptide (TPR) repeat protein